MNDLPGERREETETTEDEAMTKAKPKTEVAMNIPATKFETAEFELVGESPLIMHRWSAKARKEMLDKQMKKAKPGKEAKDPEEDYRESMYRLPGGKYGFPAVAFKSAAVDACSMLDKSVTKVMARGAFRVVGIPSEDGDLVEIDGAPRMREDMVRIGMGTADIRYRAEFVQWSAKLTVKYNANVLSLEQIVNLFNTAGFSVGVGEWRPQRDGQYGMFRISNGE